MDLIQLPCGQWVIAQDAVLTKKALAQNDIVIELELRDLPAVRRLGRGDVVADVGSFTGDTAIIFVEQGCDVWAFEPYADAFECLRRNCPGAHCLNVAVGDGRGMKTVELDPEKKGENYGMRKVYDGGPPTIRLDDLNLPRLDFIKIDVEGFEPPVMDGAKETIRRCRPVLYVEVFDPALEHHGFGRQDIYDRLRDFGYSWTVIGDEARDWYNLLGTPCRR
jgi:FkbM family methyltransferase